MLPTPSEYVSLPSGCLLKFKPEALSICTSSSWITDLGKCSEKAIVDSNLILWGPVPNRDLPRMNLLGSMLSKKWVMMLMTWWCCDDLVMLWWWCVMMLCDDIVMILWWYCDDDVWWYCWYCDDIDDIVMILWWYCDDIVMILWWYCDDLNDCDAMKYRLSFLVCVSSLGIHTCHPIVYQPIQHFLINLAVWVWVNCTHLYVNRFMWWIIASILVYCSPIWTGQEGLVLLRMRYVRTYTETIHYVGTFFTILYGAYRTLPRNIATISSEWK